MWLTLRQLWKNWNIFIVALCLLIIPVLIFSPQENTRSQTASHNVQSNNKVENSANLPAAQNLPQSGPVSSQKSSASPATQATAPPTPQKTRSSIIPRHPLPNYLSPPQPRLLVPRQRKKLTNSLVLLRHRSRQRQLTIKVPRARPRALRRPNKRRRYPRQLAATLSRAGRFSGSVRRATPWNRRKICWARRWQDCSAARLVRKRATIIRLQ